MRRVYKALILIAVLLLASCADKPDEDGYIEIKYELGDPARHFMDYPLKAKPGDIVEIKTEVLFDADIHVYVDGVELSKSHYDSDYWGYSFTMPDKNVVVTAKFYTKEEIWGS